MRMLNHKRIKENMATRFWKDQIYKLISYMTMLFSICILILLLYQIFEKGISYLSIDFFMNFASRNPKQAGIAAALSGTIVFMSIVVPVSFIFGVGTALYLEHYARQSVFTRIVELNIQTLAGVPSVVFGLLGLTIFVYGLQLGESIVTAAFTMSLLVLPTVVVSSQEAIRMVPSSLLEASYGVGATKWQTMYQIVVPTALPGILTGCVLALSRAIGEAAPLLVIGALAFANYIPLNMFDRFTVLPIQIFNWMSRPQEEFQHVAAAGMIVLLGLSLIINVVVLWLRNRK
ncbi:phosphate ABC transporter, permease protein PstA [Bacillus pseudomycoides]|uniref:phosphate ABC transporter permease PstA n=1 Tax=Bacillus pseudomycoides TaxID=64104 RepID=UPI000BEBE5AE|nr:phosphate ABC transporter permease PstA [Bacillus pseudomycoides]MED4652670.1 phosphate ABC transporter permease PstA [Bacillus pseudomycoides]PDY00981.1 phosphate ABC transporter, permease protein PstA [Bacillus pseudomycoides]PEE05605.1 phosphate ABC transporter, permease protein PstA [Bacillus pseudomycoides]PEK81501.1 phosphate ABC transporter, permease protein PstA [Bacillus pseudomycoides]PEN11624.1 phosphate ABC transporter, permease protein PstA [Bacillus pseudomycoides]